MGRRSSGLAFALGICATTAMTGLGCGRWADKLACGEDSCTFTKDEWKRVQALANVTATPAPPDLSNKFLPIADMSTGALKPYATTDPVVRLGWLLYHEPRLSGSVSNKDSLGNAAATTRPSVCGQVRLSCASCHDPQHAGSDVTSVPNHVSLGAGWYDVNAQQTLNAARYPVLYWNGRTDTLWAQAAQVMESGVSMNGYRMKTFWVVARHYRAQYLAAGFTEPAAADIDALAARLAAVEPSLVTAPIETFRAQYSPDTMTITDTERKLVDRVHVNVAKAIAAYEWLLSSDYSPLDQFASEGPDSAALSPSAVRGLKLFIGRASCIDCHNTPMLSDGKFHDIGIGQVGDHVPTVAACTKSPCDCGNEAQGSTCLPSGAFGGRQKLIAASQIFRRGSAFDDAAPDSGVPDSTPPDARLMGAWRTPSLRDVALTPPYMHDGSIASLADVVWHYAEGQGTAGLGASELSPLTLDAQDRSDLVSFLESLTGHAGPDDLITPPGPEELAPAFTATDCPPGGTP